MRISVQTGGVHGAYPIEEAYLRIREWGFDSVDANVDHLMTWNDCHQGQLSAAFSGTDKECLEYFKPWKDAAEKSGLETYQAHAPFPSFVYDENGEKNKNLLTMLEKTIMGCDYIGCRRLIVHPFFLGFEHPVDPEEEWETNIAQYSALIPAAKKYGVTICLENMFKTRRGKRYAACCADIDTACKYIDTLNDIAGEKRFGFCLDTGHMLLMGQNLKEAIIKLGDRIEAFHVHDNNGIEDQHLAPYMGIQDWNELVDGLRAIRYDKTLSFETFNIWNVVDRQMCPSMMRFIAETGRMFAERAKF